jgi:hypothetical protein
MTGIEPDKNPTQKRRASDGLRLESWKAIANHLNRSVRTVRRWESTEGLPVHRHRHAKGSSVYAFKSELSAWQAGHQETPAKDSGRFVQLTRYAALVLAAVIVGGMADRFVLSENHDHDDVVQWPESVANVLVAPIFSAWADGRVVEAFNESQSVRRQLPELPPEIQEHLAARLIDFSLLLGRLDDARSLAADLDDSDRRNALQATIAFAAGDKTRIRDVLEAGIVIEESAVARSNVFLAMAAMRSGDIAEAKTRFRDATNELVVADQGYYFIALDMLAAIIKTEGDLSGAIGLIERTMPQRNFAAHNQSGLFWLLCQRNLAKLYRDAGRKDRAIQIEDELRSRFVLADKSFPLLQSLAGA